MMIMKGMDGRIHRSLYNLFVTRKMLNDMKREMDEQDL